MLASIVPKAPPASSAAASTRSSVCIRCTDMVVAKAVTSAIGAAVRAPRLGHPRPRRPA